VRGKWERGIEPRNFAWIIRDQLAVSERPGGYARNHRKVRRHEEILWLRNQGFSRVVSLLPSQHNLHAYEELGVTWSHFPMGGGSGSTDSRSTLAELYSALHNWIAAGERLLLHQEELGDRVMGVVAGYLVATGLMDTGPHAVTVVEQILHRQMGPPGRELVALATAL
jgi:hypothetical protein